MLLHLSPGIGYHVLDFGLHVNFEALRSALQEAVDTLAASVENFDRVPIGQLKSLLQEIETTEVDSDDVHRLVQMVREFFSRTRRPLMGQYAVSGIAKQPQRQINYIPVLG